MYNRAQHEIHAAGREPVKPRIAVHHVPNYRIWRGDPLLANYWGLGGVTTRPPLPIYLTRNERLSNIQQLQQPKTQLQIATLTKDYGQVRFLV